MKFKKVSIKLKDGSKIKGYKTIVKGRRKDYFAALKGIGSYNRKADRMKDLNFKEAIIL